MRVGVPGLQVGRVLQVRPSLGLALALIMTLGMGLESRVMLLRLQLLLLLLQQLGVDHLLPQQDIGGEGDGCLLGSKCREWVGGCQLRGRGNTGRLLLVCSPGDAEKFVQCPNPFIFPLQAASLSNDILNMLDDDLSAKSIDFLKDHVSSSQQALSKSSPPQSAVRKFCS